MRVWLSIKGQRPDGRLGGPCCGGGGSSCKVPLKETPFTLPAAGDPGGGVPLCSDLFKKGVSRFLPSMGLPRAHNQDV